METNENFSNLWASFREQVKAARTKREAIYTFDESPGFNKYGGRVSFSGPEEYNGKSYVNLHTSRDNWGGLMSVSKKDLVEIAAQCMALAELMEPQPEPVDERKVVDDEQP